MVIRWLAVLAGIALSGGAWCDTYIVRNAGDSPAKRTLRWAIEQANNRPGRDKITFASWLTGKTIAPASPLPQIIDNRTVIDGDIDKDGKPDVAISGRKLTTGSGLGFSGAHWCTVKGLAVVAFPEHGIWFYKSHYGKVASCHIGVNRAGTKAVPNGRAGIHVGESDYCTIGGTTAAERNVISAGASLSDPAIKLVAASNNTISGNHIGLSADGTAVLAAGGAGVRLDREIPFATSHNVVGGTQPAARNVFGGLDYGVVLCWVSSNTVSGNWFGLLANGSALAGIGRACVWLNTEASSNVIGGTTAGAGNVFAGDAPVGVAIENRYTQKNKVQGNYFGTNAAGTRQRRLTEGIVISDEAGAQIIGGNTARAGNYFALKAPPEPTVGIRITTGAGAGTRIRYNRFGVQPDGSSGAIAMSRGIDVADAGAEVLDNVFVRTEQGIAAKATDRSLRIFRNTFRACGTGVDIAPGASCLLGNLGNTSTRDDGGNLFRPNNTWHIRNDSSNVIKAEGCRFGTTSRAEINAKIWDRQDNTLLGRVDFSPLMGGVIPTGSGVAVAGVAGLPTRGAGAEIVFSLSAPADVTVSVLNIAGRPIARVVRDRASEAGAQRVLWSGRTLDGTLAPSGTYLVEVVAKAIDGVQARALTQVRIAR